MPGTVVIFPVCWPSDLKPGRVHAYGPQVLGDALTLPTLSFAVSFNMNLDSNSIGNIR